MAGKENEALTLVKEALQSDDRNVGAWGLLAEIKAKTFSVAEFENLCVKWSKAVPSSYQAWNVLGRFHESKKMLPEAIKAYRKSLEIEWNQPSILQKLEKLEK